MEDRTLISVVIPSYNRADTVGQTIESIIAPKVDADIEIIIGDDCSTDNAREVLLKYKEQYPSIIHLIFHEHNIGLGANWATCVKACKGKYICNYIMMTIGIILISCKFRWILWKVILIVISV